MKNFSFYHLTDLHFYAAKEIGSNGESFELKASCDQKCMAESSDILDSVFDKLIGDKDCGTVVITGDLTFDGEKISHDVLVTKLQRLKDAGKQVYVTTATHDWNMEANKYDGSEVTALEKYDRKQLRERYNDFGWDAKISEVESSYSYSVIPAEGIRFLMLNDDGDGDEFCGFYDETLEWVKQQAKEAKEKGERVIAFTHHPALPPAEFYPLYSHKQMLGGYEKAVPMFADCGIEFIFTGHTHMQSISSLTTASGNKIYHVNTGCVTAFPAPYRKVTFLDNGLDIKTLNVDEVPFDLGGKTVEEYMCDHFDYMLEEIFNTMENDLERFKVLGKSFSLEESTISKFEPVFKTVGKIANRITFKQLGRLLFCGKYVDKCIENLKVKDFMLDVVRRLYSGLRCYTPDTAEYKAFMAFAKRIGRFIELKDSNTGDVVFIEDVVKDLLYDTGEIDNTNAFLPF